MTSTVLDAALCLLLVSAGAVTLVTVPDAGGADSVSGESAGGGGDALAADSPDRADALATTLTTATASVNYTLAPGARRASETPVAFPHTEGPQFERTSRGTLAGLVADATLSAVRVDGTRLDHIGDDFRRGVRARTLEAVGANTQVVAVWRPTPEGPVEGRFVVGPDPPADRSVHASVVRVPTDFPGVRRSTGTTTHDTDVTETTTDELDVTEATTDESDVAETTTDDAHPSELTAGEERERLARRVAEAVVTGLLPPTETRFALHGDYPVTALTRHRYHRLATLLGVDLDGSIAEGPAGTNVTRATHLLTDGLADSLSASFQRSESSPTEIESEIGVGHVRITVRTWGAS